MAIRADVLKVKIDVEGRNAEEQLRRFAAKVRGTAKDTQDSTQKMESGFSGMTSSLTKVGIAFASVTAAIYTLNKAMQRADDVTRLSIGFDTLNQRIGEQSALAIQKYRNAAHGLVTDQALMVQANNAMILGVAQSSDEFEELIELSLKLGTAMGRDARSSIESMITGIGRQSRLMLDNLGLMVETEVAYRKYAKQLGVAQADLTEMDKKQAFLNATLEQARIKVQGLNVETGTFSERWAQAKTSVSNAVDSILDDINRLPQDWWVLAPDWMRPGDDTNPQSYGDVGTGWRANLPRGTYTDFEKIALDIEWIELETRLEAARIEMERTLDAAAGVEARAKAAAEKTLELAENARQAADEFARMIAPVAGEVTPGATDTGQPPSIPMVVDPLGPAGVIQGAADGIVDLSGKIDDMTESLGGGYDAVSMLSLGFASLGASMIAAGLAGERSNVSFKKVLQQLAQSAIAQALYETALGIAAMTPWGFKLYGDPVHHFHAAKVFGAAGLALGLAARMGGGGGVGAATSAATTPEATAAPTPTVTNLRPVEVKVFFENGTYVTNQTEMARELVETIESEMSRTR